MKKEIAKATPIKTAKKKAGKKATPKKKISVLKAKPAPEVKKKVSLSLVMADESFKASGDAILECLDQIKPTMLKSKGVFIVRIGDLKSEKVMYPFEIKRLLSGSVSKVVFEKRMLAALR